MIKKLFCSLVVFGCVACVMSGDDVNAMDNKKKTEDLDGNDTSSQRAILSLSCRIGQLVVLTPEQWIESFKSIEKRVTFLLVDNNDDLLLELANLIIELSYPVTLENFRDFCLKSQIDDCTGKILSGLLTLFSRAALKLDESYSNHLSEDLMLIAQNVLAMKNLQQVNIVNTLTLLSKGVFRFLDTLDSI